MALDTYFDFAENDYQFFRDAYQHGLMANSLGAMAQNICERYMKHLVQEYFEPESDGDMNEKEKILRNHNLLKLMNFLDNKIDFRFKDETQDGIQIINGYYFSTRYPGDNSVELTKRNIDQCMKAITACREEIFAFIQKTEHEETES